MNMTEFKVWLEFWAGELHFVQVFPLSSEPWLSSGLLTFSPCASTISEVSAFSIYRAIKVTKYHIITKTIRSLALWVKEGRAVPLQELWLAGGGHCTRHSSVCEGRGSERSSTPVKSSSNSETQKSWLPWDLSCLRNALWCEHKWACFHSLQVSLLQHLSTVMESWAAAIGGDRTQAGKIFSSNQLQWSFPRF